MGEAEGPGDREFLRHDEIRRNRHLGWQGADLHDGAAAAHNLESVNQCMSRSGGLEHHVESAAGKFQRMLLRRRIGRIERRVRALLHGEAARELRQIAEHDLRRAEGPCGKCDQLPDRPAARDEDGGARQVSGALGGVKRDRQGL